MVGTSINLRGSAVDLGTTNADDVNEREPAGMHENATDLHDGSGCMGNTVHRVAAEILLKRHMIA